MKVCGIIAEFNPLHKGHEYILEKARSETGADYVIVVMSGDFTQRGAPALCDKHLRAHAALKAGADIVIELPVKAATSSAEFFAASGVFLLNASSVVSDIIFGTENTSVGELERIAEVLLDESESYKSHLKEGLKEGHSYPVARLDALEDILPDIHDLRTVMSHPNNILAIEYLKALKRSSSDIRPHGINRLGSGYHDKNLGNMNSSALAIRSAIESNGSLERVKNEMPVYMYDILSDDYGKLLPIYPEDLSSTMRYRLISEVYSAKDLTQYSDISKSLADRICKNVKYYNDQDSFISRLKSREITYTRISRGLLHILLDIKAPEEVLNENNSYISILGFKEAATPLIKMMNTSSSVPVLSSLSDAKKALSGDALQTFNDTLKASDIYNGLIENKFNTKVNSELSRKTEKHDDIFLS